MSIYICKCKHIGYFCRTFIKIEYKKKICVELFARSI